MNSDLRPGSHGVGPRLLIRQGGSRGRRAFLSSLVSLPALPAVAFSARVEPRAEEAYRLRSTLAAYRLSHPEPAHPANTDERDFPNGLANYSKGLPHDDAGEPTNGSYQKLVSALAERRTEGIETVPLAGNLRLVNPAVCSMFVLEGSDAQQFSLPVPPSFGSLEQASEMAELYWMALVRDVPFAHWEQDATIQSSVADLSGFNTSGLNCGNLFRLSGVGISHGPYISQFLLNSIPQGGLIMDQRYFSPVPGQAFATSTAEWLALQNGARPTVSTNVEGVHRYIATPRSLAEYVHRDYPFQAYLCAALQLDSYGNEALSDRNPYKRSRTQSGFVTFGAPHVIDLMSRATNAALIASWFQKWSVHRRIRPEEYAARVHFRSAGANKYPLHEKLLQSEALGLTHFAHGSHLLPQAYPEGCPAHPAYPAGHAAIAGACVTVLKAFYRGDFVIPHLDTPDANGLQLSPFSNQNRLTVEGELNKLASNIAMARNFAGIHWRSDGSAGLRLGEAVATSILQDHIRTVPEAEAGFSFITFDGQPVTIDGASA